jgi:hypothetical protein
MPGVGQGADEEGIDGVVEGAGVEIGDDSDDGPVLALPGEEMVYGIGRSLKAQIFSIGIVDDNLEG